MHALLAEGMQSGEVEPLPWTVFSAGKVQDAFRYLASGAPRASPLIAALNPLHSCSCHHPPWMCSQCKIPSAKGGPGHSKCGPFPNS